MHNNYHVLFLSRSRFPGLSDSSSCLTSPCNIFHLLRFHFLPPLARIYWSINLKSAFCPPHRYSEFCEKQPPSVLHQRPPRRFLPIRFLNRMMSAFQRVIPAPGVAMRIAPPA